MVTSWAFASVGVERLELPIEPADRTSVRTAEQCGFRQEGLLLRRRKIGAERRGLLMLRCREETWP
jgi:RimJ/RimL family protein N-acetyltransferase